MDGQVRKNFLIKCFTVHYLGATDVDVEDTWTWSDGTTWSYTNWWTGGGGQPAGGTVQNCAQFR